MVSRPGTVSKLLWHFTGGPRWNTETKKQLKEPKPAIDAYNALKSIVESFELKVGQYHETVSFIIKEKEMFDLDTKTMCIVKDKPYRITSAPVCCLADIPLQHLGYHSIRYGKIAIGFHRDAIVKFGFNPVLYTTETTNLINSIFDGWVAVENAHPEPAMGILDELESMIDVDDDDDDDKDKIEQCIVDLKSELEKIEMLQLQVDTCIENTLAYMKTFDESDFDSIYCEREWRSTKNFSFTINDIAMILLPREQDGVRFYERFLQEVNLPRTVTIACWEDLLEH